MKLFEFAWCREYPDRLAALAELSPEKWSFGDGSDNAILRNYIDHTYGKLREEGKIVETERYAIFNTGLFTPAWKEIYAFLVPNPVPGKQRYQLDGFYPAFRLASQGIAEFPPRADYFSDPSALVFDAKCDIFPQYDHIFSPLNLCRIPIGLRGDPQLTERFDTALRSARARIHANYKTAVPQYYRGRIQLLIPVCLLRDGSPDLALVVCKNEAGTQYIGYTCLTLEMAYNNARLIARPDSEWLRP